MMHKNLHSNTGHFFSLSILSKIQSDRLPNKIGNLKKQKRKLNRSFKKIDSFLCLRFYLNAYNQRFRLNLCKYKFTIPQITKILKINAMCSFGINKTHEK